MIHEELIQQTLEAPTRSIGARVELLEGEALVHTFNHSDAIKSITIERVGEESKFFGFGVCQKLNLHLLDVERQIAMTTANSLMVSFNVVAEYWGAFPAFHVTECNRDENTNELSVTAYDAIYRASEHTVEELMINTGTIESYAEACGALLGLPVAFDGVDPGTLAINYVEGANFEGTETIREALDAIAEATQTIYFIAGGVVNGWNDEGYEGIHKENVLTFKRLADDPVLTIGKDQYFTLDSGDNRRLATIAHVTDLGDNVSASITESGSTQYVRNNPFWDLREDITAIVENALAAVGGMTINQFDCKWRGNFLLEPGDCVELVRKDNSTALSYVLNDTIEYDGSLTASMGWKYTEGESASTNPTNLGEAIKETFARVDKANKTITMVASEATANASNIASLQANTESINATVESLKTTSEEAIGGLGESVAELTNRVNAQITDEQMNIAIEKAVNDGAKKVETSTGFKFDENGLEISKSDSTITTQITEDGMKVKEGNEDVLTANSAGVNAKNLHATTYLIVGKNSRFEDFGNDRTGCFWIGG